MSSLTCNTCNARFENSKMQCEHYKSDWHRYNLKRRVSQLPPITAEQFQERVLEIRRTTESAIEEQQTTIFCHACHKHFGTQKSHDNHLNSKKHKENVFRFNIVHAEDHAEVTTKSKTLPRSHPAHSAAAALHKHKDIDIFFQDSKTDDDDDDDDDFEDIKEEEVDSDEWDKIAENPLTEKDCLFCKHQSDDTVANLKHMSVAHSFFIPDIEYCFDIDGLLYYLGEKIANYYICLWCNDRGKTFYSLDAVRKHMIDKGHCQMLHEGVALAEYADYYDYSSSYPDHKEGMNIDEEVVPDLIDGDDYQLVLPSGAVVGHRSLLRYYKQRLHPERGIIRKKAQPKLHKVLTEYRALGWTHTQQQAAARKARDLHLMKRVQSKWQMKLGIKANKLQKHYRQQILM